MKTKKILIISNLYPSKKDPFYGTFVKNFTDSLYNYGNFSHINLCVIKGRSSNIFEKICKYISFYLQILYQLTFHNYNIVYVHIITHAAIPLRFISLFRHLPLIFNIHGEDLITQTKLSNYFLELVKPLLIKAQLIVVPSYFFAKKAQQLIPQINTQKIYISPSGGIKQSFFQQDSHANATNTFNIGYVSRIDRGKGWDTFIDAIKILKEKNISGLKAQIIGNGHEVDEMKQKINITNLDIIEYLGPIPYDQLPLYYKKFDIFIFPTKLEESLGLVGLEAMASRVPVIGSHIGGLTDYIIDKVNGFYFEPNNAKDLADKIYLYYTQPLEKQNLMKENAYKTALSYQNEKISKSLSDKIDSLI